MSLRTKYSLDAQIGEGGLGVVYQGVRRSDGVPVAIKVVKKARCNKFTPDGTPWEVALLAKVQDVPGVVQMLDYYNHADAYYIVMEKFGGGDLFDYILVRGGLNEDPARKIFKQVLDTTMECYNRGIAHRDIKDENILLDHDTLTTKVIDFGEATFVRPEKFKKFLGTPENSPPEWLINREYTLKGLMPWLLGVLLFTLASGQAPFEKTQQIERMDIDWSLLKGCSPDLQSLVHGCLTRDPCKRMTLQEVSHCPWVMALAEDADRTQL